MGINQLLGCFGAIVILLLASHYYWEQLKFEILITVVLLTSIYWPSEWAQLILALFRELSI